MSSRGFQFSRKIAEYWELTCRPAVAMTGHCRGSIDAAYDFSMPEFSATTCPEPASRWDELATELRHGRLALFCGAGISMAPPSRLPNWRQLADAVVIALTEQVEPRDNVARLLDARLRPDVVMEIMQDVVGDVTLGALAVLDRDAPNLNHRLIAHLAATAGLRRVVTTNFDRLIEVACEAIGVPVRVIVTDADYALPDDDRLTLYKLHGTIERPDTLMASIRGLARGLDEGRASCLTRLLTHYHVMFLGYSGQDFGINSDYLALERAEPAARGFTWNLRPGESSWCRRARSCCAI
jgi:hypothetical protein